MLLEYVRNVALSIIAEKRQNGTAPLCATRSEIMLRAREDITECMRALHAAGEFVGKVNINKIPMLCPND